MATVEVGIVEYEGHKFSALGSVIDVERGVLIGYPFCHHLRTWNGEVIAPIWKTGEARGFNGTRLVCYRATYAGFSWYGRGLGEHCVLRMKRGKKVTNG